MNQTLAPVCSFYFFFLDPTVKHTYKNYFDILDGRFFFLRVHTSFFSSSRFNTATLPSFGAKTHWTFASLSQLSRHVETGPIVHQVASFVHVRAILAQVHSSIVTDCLDVLSYIMACL